MEPPYSIDAEPVDDRLQEDLFHSLVQSADYVDGQTLLPARSEGALQLATPEAIRSAFAESWDALSHTLGLGINPDQALVGVRQLRVYDLADRTRSRLSVPFSCERQAVG